MFFQATKLCHYKQNSKLVRNENCIIQKEASQKKKCNLCNFPIFTATGSVQETITTVEVNLSIQK